MLRQIHTLAERERIPGLLVQLRGFEDSFRAGADPVVLGEIQRTDCSGHIQQKLSRTRNVLTIDAGPDARLLLFS